MPEISFTNFLDFSSAQTSTRLRVVRKEVEQQGSEYSPARDYWRQLRLGIIEQESNDFTPARLQEVATEAAVRKQANYRQRVDQYLRWRGGRVTGFFEPSKGRWQLGDLSVRVNPELGLHTTNGDLLVKLYFRQDPLDQRRLPSALHLLHHATRRAKATAVILDVARGREHLAAPLPRDGRILLEADAEHFMALWNRLV